jgi:hypothetical protein
VENSSTPSKRMKKFIEASVVLQTETLLTTVVVDAGTVYNVAEDVPKDPLASAFNVVGIYFSPIE